MAPGLLVDDAVDGAFTGKAAFRNEDAPLSVFPDGIRTSGQHAPLYEVLRPYTEFPKEITGSTVWKAEDYINNPERWVHAFTDEEIEELSQATDAFTASGLPLTGISKVSSG